MWDAGGGHDLGRKLSLQRLLWEPTPAGQHAAHDGRCARGCARCGWGRMAVEGVMLERCSLRSQQPVRQPASQPIAGCSPQLGTNRPLRAASGGQQTAGPPRPVGASQPIAMCRRRSRGFADRDRRPRGQRASSFRSRRTLENTPPPDCLGPVSCPAASRQPPAARRRAVCAPDRQLS